MYSNYLPSSAAEKQRIMLLGVSCVFNKYSIIITNLYIKFLAAMSSSRSDDVTQSSVRPSPFFKFEAIRLIHQKNSFTKCFQLFPISPKKVLKILSTLSTLCTLSTPWNT